MRVFFTTFLYLFSTLVVADSAEKRFTPLSTQSLLETGGGLLLILVLIIGGAWLFKRYGQLPMAGKNLVSVLGGVSVGPRERVVVLSIDETRLVIGVAPGQVRTLHVFETAQREEGSFQSQFEVAKQEEKGI